MTVLRSSSPSVDMPSIVFESVVRRSRRSVGGAATHTRSDQEMAPLKFSTGKCSRFVNRPSRLSEVLSPSSAGVPMAGTGGDTGALGRSRKENGAPDGSAFSPPPGRRCG